ncbi:MAG: hypothetical protein B7Y39_08635 [Bdellovibrio sp. 28-41-41]|nr:MAG: hypothetical protein B7Y39_08635 [Bdellovibrio sp. 28-41-41]
METILTRGMGNLQSSTSQIQAAKIFVFIGRASIFVSFLSLIGAWITQVSGGYFLGMSQQHLFFDSIALSLLGIGFLADSFLHAKGL